MATFTQIGPRFAKMIDDDGDVREFFTTPNGGYVWEYVGRETRQVFQRLGYRGKALECYRPGALADVLRRAHSYQSRPMRRLRKTN